MTIQLQPYLNCGNAQARKRNRRPRQPKLEQNTIVNYISQQWRQETYEELCVTKTLANY